MEDYQYNCSLCGNPCIPNMAICNSCLKIIANRKELPGTNKVEWREYRYVADDGNDYFVQKNKQNQKQSLFDKVTSLFEIAKSGGVIAENCKLWLPTNELFHALSYRGDIEGWRKQIEQASECLGLLTGKIDENYIELSDGRIYILSECRVEFY